MPHPLNQIDGPAEGTGGRGERLRRLVEAFTGLTCEADREGRLLQALDEAAAESEVSASALIKALARPEGVEAFRRLRPLISRLVTSETYFFRDPGQMEGVRDVVLPDLAGRRAGGALRVWSAGCSTGEEAYTLAFLLHEALGPEAASRSIILGTDIDVDSLAEASRAVYGRNSLRGLTGGTHGLYFQGAGEGLWRVRDPYRLLVHFRPHNLVLDPLPDPELGLAAVDLIFCRNVLQYFRAATARKVVDGLCRSLAPGGYLVTGHAEIEPEWLADLEAVHTPGSVVYRRSEARRQAAAENKPPDDRHDGETARCRSVLLARAKQIVERIDRQRGITSHRIGRMLADAGKTEAAIVTLERALRREPLDVQARYLLALLELERGRQAAGEAHLRKVLLLAPDHLPALLCLGRRLKEQGQTGEAASMFGRMRLILHGRDDREQVLYADGLTVGEVRGILRPLGEE